MHRPAGSGTAQLPSHCCLGPNPGASGQALRTPPARVGPRASEKPGPRASESSVPRQPDGEAQGVSPRGRPQVLPPSSSPSPQQQEAPVGQETRARLLGGLGRAAGTKALRPVTTGPGGPAPAMGGLGRGPMSWAPEENLRRPGAEPGPPCASLGSEVGVDCPSTRAAQGGGCSSGPDLAPWLGRHTGSRATTCDCVAGSGTAESPQPGVRGWGWAQGGWVPPGSASA